MTAGAKSAETGEMTMTTMLRPSETDY